MIKEVQITRRQALKVTLGFAALAAGCKTPEMTPEVELISPQEGLIIEFDQIFERLKKLPENKVTALAETQEGYEFRQGNYRYILVKINPEAVNPERVLERIYYHGLEKEAPSEPVIEFSISPEGVDSNYRWFGRGKEVQRSEKIRLSWDEAFSLLIRFHKDFSTWIK